MQGSVLSLASSDAMPYPFTAPVSALAPLISEELHVERLTARRLGTVVGYGTALRSVALQESTVNLFDAFTECL